MPSNNIKKYYSDALYWAISPLSKDKVYHITRSDESILRKLIHYSKTNEKITYSNKIIGEHMFLKESTLEKGIPRLNKKGFISCANFKITCEGEIKIRRTIYIQWNKLEFILSDIPTNDVKEENEINVEGNNNQFQLENSIEDDKTNEMPETLEKVDNKIPNIYLNQEKVSWIIDDFKKKGEKKREEEIRKLDNKELFNLLYNDGVWNIRYDNDGSVVEMENQHGIRKTSKHNKLCNLEYVNSTIDSNKDFETIDFEHYLKNNDIQFKDITLDRYYKLIDNGLLDSLHDKVA